MTNARRPIGLSVGRTYGAALSVGQTAVGLLCRSGRLKRSSWMKALRRHRNLEPRLDYSNMGRGGDCRCCDVQ